MKQYKKEDTIVYFNDQSNLWILEAIEKKEYETIMILKDNQRSFVSIIKFINFPDKKFIFKIPKEKNNNKKDRFFSIFKGGEAKREFRNLERTLNAGFLAPTPFIAIEKKKGLQIVDSILILEFISDNGKKRENIPIVLETLYKIHNKGYLHGDAQLVNFLVQEDEVFLIDCKMSKNYFGFISKIKEFIYFEKSCHQPVSSIYKENYFFFFLKKFDIYKDKFNYFTKWIRGKKGGKKRV